MIDTREQYTGHEVGTNASEAGGQGSDSLRVEQAQHLGFALRELRIGSQNL